MLRVGVKSEDTINSDILLVIYENKRVLFKRVCVPTRFASSNAASWLRRFRVRFRVRRWRWVKSAPHNTDEDHGVGLKTCGTFSGEKPPPMLLSDKSS